MKHSAGSGGTVASTSLSLKPRPDDAVNVTLSANAVLAAAGLKEAIGSGANKHLGFLNFSTSDDAAAAAPALDGQTLAGVVVSVKHSGGGGHSAANRKRSPPRPAPRPAPRPPPRPAPRPAPRPQARPPPGSSSWSACGYIVLLLAVLLQFPEPFRWISSITSNYEYEYFNGIKLRLLLCLLLLLGVVLATSDYRTVKCYVFLDNSNIFIPFQKLKRVVNAQGLLDFARTKRWIRCGYCCWRPVRCCGYCGSSRTLGQPAVLMGSTPPASDAVWNKYKAAGWEVNTADRRGGGEQGVDDFLHGKIMACLSIEHRPSPCHKFLVRLSLARRPVIVLFSGDGNDNTKTSMDSSVSFPHVLRQTLQDGFDVDVCAVSTSFSKHLKKLRDDFGGTRVALVELDDKAHIDKVSFARKKSL